MNEIIFFIEVLTLVFCTRIALKMGKEALIGITALQAVLANLFVLKQISLFSLNATCGDAFAVSGIFGLNLLQRYFDKEAAKKAINLSLMFMGLFTAASMLHLMLIPSTSDFSQAAFFTILAPSPRIVLSSILAFYIVQQFDVAFFGWLNQKMRRYSWHWRSLIALLISQLVDTVLFTSLALTAVATSLWEVMVVAFCIKAATIAIIFTFSLLKTHRNRHEI